MLKRFFFKEGAGVGDWAETLLTLGRRIECIHRGGKYGSQA